MQKQYFVNLMKHAPEISYQGAAMIQIASNQFYISY